MKKLLNNIINEPATSPLHIISMLKALAFITAVLLIIINMSEIVKLQENVETYKNLLLEEIHDQNLIIINLQDYVDEQEVLNHSFNNRIHDNFLYINKNSGLIIDNTINIDEVSYKGIMTYIDELIEDVERLEKAVY